MPSDPGTALATPAGPPALATAAAALATAHAAAALAAAALAAAALAAAALAAALATAALAASIASRGDGPRHGQPPPITLASRGGDGATTRGSRPREARLKVCRRGDAQQVEALRLPG